MTTTYTLRIPVHAWRVSADGSLPEEARKALPHAKRVIGERSDEEMARWTTDALIMAKHGVQWRIPDRHYDYWQWWDEGTSCDYHASAGMWIVTSEYGVEAMSDEQFRECCTENTHE